MGGSVDWFIAGATHVTGKEFNFNLLREAWRLSSLMFRSHDRLVNLNKAVPTPYNVVTDETVCQGGASALRGESK